MVEKLGQRTPAAESHDRRTQEPAVENFVSFNSQKQLEVNRLDSIPSSIKSGAADERFTRHHNSF
jgi:hypothetical protein